MTIFLIAFYLNAHSIDNDLRSFNYSKADSIALNCNQKFTEPLLLSHALTKELYTEHEKFRAIFRWVTNNIAYSYAGRNKDVKYVLKKKKAVCSGYASLLKELCDYANVDCEIVVGYAKSVDSSVGKIKEANHAWNAVRLSGEWYLVDATWAAGYVEKRKFSRSFNEYYFLSNPEEFMFSHFPVNPNWFLTDSPIKKRDFEKLPLRTELYFAMGITESKVQNGELKNKFRYEFSCNETVHKISLKHVRRKEFLQIDFKAKNGVVMFEFDLKNLPLGYFDLFVNGRQVLKFKHE